MVCGACPDTQVASLAQILNTCKHYEFKVAHRYDTKSMAARLLFDLSSEVQTLALALLNAGFGKSPKLAQLEEATKEWNDTFGSNPSGDVRGAACARNLVAAS